MCLDLYVSFKQLALLCRIIFVRNLRSPWSVFFMYMVTSTLLRLCGFVSKDVYMYTEYMGRFSLLALFSVCVWVPSAVERALMTLQVLW